MSSEPPKNESTPADAAAPARPPAAQEPGPSDAPNAQKPGADERSQREITIRRAPKFVPFLLLGGLLGLIAAGLITFYGPANPDFARTTVLGFFSMVFLVPGLLLGALAALTLDWFSVRRSERAYVQRAADEPADPHEEPTEPSSKQ